MSAKIGFIGLGAMGLPMAKNLVKANYDVIGLNRSKGKEQLFIDAGGKGGYTLSEIVQECDILMTCLPFPHDVEEVILGDEGIVKHGRNGQYLIDFSTVSPTLNQKVYEKANEKGMKFLDAPISGGNFGAEEGTLSIMVGGDKEVFESMLPYFQILGENIYHVGKCGSGSIVKLVNNLMVGFHTQAVAEALNLGEKMGVDSDVLFDILHSSYAQSRVFDRHYENFISKNEYEPGFAMKLLHKDLKIAGELADEKNIPLPIGKQVTAMMKEAVDSGHGDDDMSALYLYLKK
ncbi:3-hydroxyisobutyrate dehydrogenase [Pueribacillus theae]|uniref:3-hydroxyisobutyrate dehydrogenase n=1 Tax=Pueribacillus theae TaxID=2171751 RepID=A0A2U1K861_9BACI|nr:NAD(P)-dependent oxidoreductase [Pueribacillus theae]PWA13273.1 3-hydroxyisobutyrate dehydrogenase [Pueribacillus theae]